MKKVRVDSLKGKEILASPVISSNDSVLVHADVELNDEIIGRLNRLGVETVYIYEEETDKDTDTKVNSKEDKPVHVFSVEETIADTNDVIMEELQKHVYKHNEELKKIGVEAEKIIQGVISEPEVIDNITEVRNISTDMYTHCINVCSLATIMALRLKMTQKQVHDISMGAILHDIGLRYVQVPYINIDDTELSLDDRTAYRKHTIYGYSSLQDEEWISGMAKEIILFHHEKLDGSGYPFKQPANKLSSEVRLVSICDDFDSMISGIGSRKMKVYEAIEYIKCNAGIKYDVTIAHKFLESVAAYPMGVNVILSNGEKGTVVRQNREISDRPVVKITQHADGSAPTSNEEINLMKTLTVFIVDTE